MAIITGNRLVALIPLRRVHSSLMCRRRANSSVSTRKSVARPAKSGISSRYIPKPKSDYNCIIGAAASSRAYDRSASASRIWPRLTSVRTHSGMTQIVLTRRPTSEFNRATLHVSCRRLCDLTSAGGRLGAEVMEAAGFEAMRAVVSLWSSGGNCRISSNHFAQIISA